MQHVVPGDVAWVLVSTVLVLLMTVPGLALFYAGMVRKKNVLATMMQSFILCAAMTVVWVVAGYSLAFTNGNAWVGDLSRLFLNGLADGWDKPFTLGAGTAAAQPTTIPESVFLMFQMAFAIITPAVVTGSCADRMKFSALLVFFTLWSLVVYAPLAHWVWAPTGWLAQMGVADFAGGTVVEINCGVSGLVCALMLGRRLGYGQENMAPWNLSYAVIGASLLWVGWMGFNSGGALAANGRAGMAVLVTQIATATAALSWMAIEWIRKSHVTMLGACSGAVAGLVAITPASGFVGVGGAMAIGFAAGFLCYWGATGLKHMLGADDSLDVFGIHGVGGIVGAILTGVFADRAISGTDANMLMQVAGTLTTLVYSGVMTWIILVVVDWVAGLRVSDDDEQDGLDISQHAERVN